MTYYESVQIAAASPADASTAPARETIRNFVVCVDGRTPVARKRGSSDGKFSASQGLENSQNEEIAILREPVPQVGLRSWRGLRRPSTRFGFHAAQRLSRYGANSMRGRAPLDDVVGRDKPWDKPRHVGGQQGPPAAGADPQ